LWCVSFVFFFSSRRRHTRCYRDWSSDVCSSDLEFLAELSSRSRTLTKVPVYQWALPEDLQPMRECVLGLLNGMIDVVLFMTAVRSEERRVGKEWRCGWCGYDGMTKNGRITER